MAANLSLAVIEGLGLAALIVLLALRWRPKQVQWTMPVVLALSLLAAGSLFHTANLGGQIRHSEVRGTVQASGGGDRAIDSQGAGEQRDRDED
jgi:hypothetical protein